MSLYRYKENLNVQIIETKGLLEIVGDHPLMSYSLAEKLKELQQEFDELPEKVDEPSIRILFSGKAVLGSKGIRADFLSKTLRPFQEMIKTQASIVRFGQVGDRGQVKGSPKADLYLTALPTGSFGVELTQLEREELFEGEEISIAMKQVMSLIDSSSKDEDSFEQVISDIPRRMFTNLKKFLKEVSEENSIVKMECGEMGVEVSKENVALTYLRINNTITDDYPVVIDGIFRGILLDSGKFEMLDEEGKQISGFISKELSEDELVSYDTDFLNQNCQIHLLLHRTIFKSGKDKIEYELLEIKSK